jgi:hypothetical protein
MGQMLKFQKCPFSTKARSKLRFFISLFLPKEEEEGKVQERKHVGSSLFWCRKE